MVHARPVLPSRGSGNTDPSGKVFLIFGRKYVDPAVHTGEIKAACNYIVFGYCDRQCIVG